MGAQTVRAPALVENKPFTAADPAEAWSRVRELASTNPSVLVAVDAAELESIGPDAARLIVKDATKAQYVRSRQGQLEELLGKVVARRIRIDVKAALGSASARPAATTGVDTAGYAQAMNHPLVRRAMDLFNARVIAVGPDQAGGTADRSEGTDV